MYQRGRLALLVGVDVTVLALLAPDWHELGRAVSAPRDQIARVGADAVATQLGDALLWGAALWLAVGLGCAFGRLLPGILGRTVARLGAAMLPRTVVRLTAVAAGFAVVTAPVAAQAAGTGAHAPAGHPVSAVLPAPLWPSDAAVLSSGPPAGTAGSAVPSAATSASRSAVPSRAQSAAPSAVPPAWRSTTTAVPPANQQPPIESGGAAGTPPEPSWSVTVHDGDSLWGIAAESGATAKPGAAAATWQQWYQANRAEIGADPNLIHPGQVLHAPAGTDREVQP